MNITDFRTADMVYEYDAFFLTQSKESESVVKISKRGLPSERYDIQVHIHLSENKLFQLMNYKNRLHHFGLPLLHYPNPPSLQYSSTPILHAPEPIFR
jgi:hypothetical protein